MTSQQETGQRRSWPVPASLVLLSAIPLAAGSLRLVQLAGGPALIPADDRFGGFPAALIIHIVGALTFALVGALQFVPRFRRHHRTWHRRAGRLVTGAGLAIAGSALWLTLVYEAQPGTGDLLYVLRIVFASAMAASLLLGITAIRRHDIAAHRAWMIRAYAIGLAAGTQTFTQGIAAAIVGTGELRMDLAKGAGWVINLAVAEWTIRRARTSRRRHPQPRSTTRALGGSRRTTTMTRPNPSPAPSSRAGPIGTETATYEIRVVGHLDDHWAAMLDDLTLDRLDDGTTRLTGPLIDQAQLHGLLARIRDLGVPLLTLRTVELSTPGLPRGRNGTDPVPRDDRRGIGFRGPRDVGPCRCQH